MSSSKRPRQSFEKSSESEGGDFSNTDRCKRVRLERSTEEGLPKVATTAAAGLDSPTIKRRKCNSSSTAFTVGASAQAAAVVAAPAGKPWTSPIAQAEVRSEPLVSQALRTRSPSALNAPAVGYITAPALPRDQVPSLALRSPASAATRGVWTVPDVQPAASKSPSAASTLEASPRRAAPAAVESSASGVAQADVHPKASRHSTEAEQLSRAPGTEEAILVENDATTATGNKVAVPPLCSQTSKVRSLALKGMKLIVSLFSVWMVWTLSVFAGSRIRGAVWVGGFPNKEVAESLLQQTQEMRSVWNVRQARQEHLLHEQATNDEIAKVVMPLWEGIKVKMAHLRQEAESIMASGGSQQTTRSHLSELEEMTEALSRAQEMASTNLAAAGYADLEEVGATIVDLTDDSEVSVMSREEIGDLVRREIEIFTSRELENYASVARGASVVREQGLTSPPMNPAKVAEEALSASTSIGHCFAFEGGSGKLTVRLGGRHSGGSFTPDDSPKIVRISHISIAHTSVAVTPGAAKTAPRVFNVLGWASDPKDTAQEPFVLVIRETYSVDATMPTKMFEVSSPTPVGWVTLEVESNHGGERTCIYGFRVHGEEVG